MTAPASGPLVTIAAAAFPELLLSALSDPSLPSSPSLLVELLLLDPSSPSLLEELLPPDPPLVAPLEEPDEAVAEEPDPPPLTLLAAACASEL